MKNVNAVFIWCGILLLNINLALAADWREQPKIARVFAEAKVTGTFVFYDPATRQFYGYNHDRAQTQYYPASTFKIPNSLIGLSVGAVKDVEEVLPYGGKPQMFPAWEQDLGLRDAIKISAVPIYQELARRIGLQNMRDSVSKLAYGNADIGKTVDNFWLVGPLKISAMEQAKFLADLAQDQLPFPRRNQSMVRDIIFLGDFDGWRLYGKTGWADAPDPDVGWWVGWITKTDKTYSFALNIDVHSKADADRRLEIGKESLRLMQQALTEQSQPTTK